MNEYAQMLNKVRKTPAMKDIVRWTKGRRGALFLLCFFNLLSALLSVSLSMTTKWLIDGAVDGCREDVIRFGSILAATVLSIQGLGYVRSVLMVRIKAALLKNIRSDVFEALLHKDYSAVSAFHSGEIINRIFSDVEVVAEGIMVSAPRTVSALAAFFGAVVVLMRIDWKFLLILIGGGLLAAIVILAFRNPIKRNHKRVQETEGELHAYLQESVANLKIIKASDSETRIGRQALGRQNRFLEAQIKRGQFSAGLNSILSLVFQLSWLYAMLWGGVGIYKGNISYGTLTAILQLVGQIQSPIANCVTIAAASYGMIASAERLLELRNLKSDESEEEKNGEMTEEMTGEMTGKPTFARLDMEGLKFSYETEEPVLKDVKLTVKRGEFVSVTGPSGCGKSTMFQLILGIYEPEEGKVAFATAEDGSMAPSRRTRRMIAYVPQGNILFSGTIGENIAMFTDGANKEQIRRAAKLACIDTFIDSLKDGYNTVIGERGARLSEGQAQRIAVARALLTDADLLLLDEATSALDEETEAQLLRNLRTLEDKTVMIVTHRKAALGICDHHVFVEDRTVVVDRQ